MRFEGATLRGLDLFTTGSFAPGVESTPCSKSAGKSRYQCQETMEVHLVQQQFQKNRWKHPMVVSMYKPQTYVLESEIV